MGGFLGPIRLRRGISGESGPSVTGSPITGDAILRSILLDAGFQDTDHTKLRYIARLENSAVGTEDGQPVVYGPLLLTLDDKTTHFDVMDDVLSKYPPNYHLECDANGHLQGAYMTQGVVADYDFELTEQVERLDSLDDVRTLAIHRGSRRIGVNLALAANGGTIFAEDLSDLPPVGGEPLWNDINHLIDGVLGDGTEHWVWIPGGGFPRPDHGWWMHSYESLLWGFYLDSTVPYYDPRLAMRDLFVVVLPDNVSAAPLDHIDRDVADVRQPIGLVQVMGGPGWEHWVGSTPEWRDISFDLQVYYYDSDVIGFWDHSGDFPSLASTDWKALCDGGESDALGVSSHQWAELDEEVIGKKFAKYLLFKLRRINAPAFLDGDLIPSTSARWMMMLQEVRVWLPGTLYGYAKLGATAPYNTAADVTTLAQYRQRTYLSEPDYYLNSQTAVDARALTELGELYRNYGRLRVRGVRPDARVGQTVRVTNPTLGLDALYLIESVRLNSNLTAEVEIVAYR